MATTPGLGPLPRTARVKGGGSGGFSMRPSDWLPLVFHFHYMIPYINDK